MPAGPLRFDATEVREVLRMIESESLDVRAVTMGVSLRDSASENLDADLRAHLREADARRRAAGADDEGGRRTTSPCRSPRRACR